MHPGHRMAAERALRALLIGATFVGAHWYGTLDSVLARPHDGPDGKPYDIAYDEIHLFIEAPFALFSARPITMPDRVEDMPRMPFDEQVATLARAARDPIKDVALGEQYPHLILTFESGRVFFLNGYDKEFESWSVRTTSAAGGDWTIVATPGGNIAVFDPKRTIHLG